MKLTSEHREREIDYHTKLESKWKSGHECLASVWMYSYVSQMYSIPFSANQQKTKTLQPLKYSTVDMWNQCQSK